jgi:hypothetical protein
MEWKPTFISKYSISNTGILRNKRGLYVKPNVSNCVYLHDKHKVYYVPMWVLVANAFIPPTSRILEHIDGNPSNNNVANLRYIVI